MEQEKQLHWFPGHMAKAKRAIVEKLPIIDVVVEILDARAPNACQSKDLENLISNKKRLIVLNKADLADKKITELWSNYFLVSDVSFLVTEALTKKIRPDLIKQIKLVHQKKLQQQIARGIKNPKIRVLVLGLPNVGKSTFINNLVQRKVTRTANRPGVTRGQQWIKLDETIDLLDSPGILAPKIENDETKIILALINSLPLKSVFLDEVSNFALKFLMENYPDYLLSHYQISFNTKKVTNESLADYFVELAKKYHFKLSEKQFNIERARNLLIHDLQAGKLGLISYERPTD